MRRTLLLVMLPVVALTVIGLLILWPDGDRKGRGEELGFDTDLYNGSVVNIERVPCTAPRPDGGKSGCTVAQVELAEGPDRGTVISLPEDAGGPSSVRLHTGDKVVLGYTPGAEDQFAYAFADFQRRTSMIVLAALFGVAVLALGRHRGLFALLALGISLAVLVRFVLPSILEGNNALAVAIVGSSAIMLVALYLTHGVSERTTTAVLGTLASLGLTGVLAFVFVSVTKLTGQYSEEALYLQVAAQQVNLRGLLLGGIIIGSLGVLDDVTVTQVSAVWELHEANPKLSAAALYRAALRIGRDHIASTVNTLVLAYAGASLPLLILFVEVDRRLDEVLTGEVVAIEVIRTLVGSIGLVASVPITTALAAIVVTRSAVWERRQTRR